MEAFINRTGPSGNLELQNCGSENFLYFAYGSNLLRERIMLRNPSVAFLTIAQLLDYKLAFGSHQGKPSLQWKGGTATIVYSPGEEVWGIIWKMNTSDLYSLDRQEGVENGIYIPIEVTVRIQDGKIVKCRSYQMNDYVLDLPSPQYKKVICMGAKQNELPVDYQKKLNSIETNNYAGSVPVLEEIEAALNASGKQNNEDQF
ncbi:gamma-glutamylcyclotransferase [Thamnophis elegans]|uniref:gamma-glutamylcyclotransferase n=1 Tax=Thamnophis elegans TaxID=35005 RepID=UPI0013781A8B|nr:gamma-glutamylcyclotransferase [Thamnophis elegans]XP_032091464.1 gamma-glutamylcyclotransferase [Thamnophis elegans]XP_032091465.1 gamma-glutamylcyclotransferase [Thamnophis elegans]XP_032091466.1 gamma-glutamylcyclotransferase [Thamnophis elegans]XP_032091467.1 gamma-glutamylcyclotransferase [Thamnophis elegans]